MIQTLDSFFDELTKIAETKEPPRQITKERLQRFAQHAVPGAIGAGLGFGGTLLLGRPIEDKLVRLGIQRGPAKAMRYLLPTAAGLGAAYTLAKTNLGGRLIQKVLGEQHVRNDTDKRQSPG